MTKTISKHVQKKPKKITESYLHNYGFFYLERFSSSKNNFINVLKRRAQLSCRAHPEQSLEQCYAMIKAVADKFEQSGLLNDTVYTESKINSLKRRGFSEKKIHQTLSQKGLSNSLIQSKIDSYNQDHNFQETLDSELASALIFAQKKKLGPYSNPLKLNDPQKAMAAFARAGYSYQIAKKIIETEIIKDD